MLEKMSIILLSFVESSGGWGGFVGEVTSKFTVGAMVVGVGIVGCGDMEMDGFDVGVRLLGRLREGGGDVIL